MIIQFEPWRLAFHVKDPYVQEIIIVLIELKSWGEKHYQVEILSY